MKTEELNDKDALEIQQIICDDDRKAEKMGLLDEEKKKHEVVEAALHSLAVNGIRAYIYADVPTSSAPPGIPTVYQFNTMASFFEYDEDGNRTEKSIYDGCFFHSALWVSLIENTIMFSSLAKEMGVVNLDPHDPTTHRKKMQFVDYYLTMCYRDAQEKTREVLNIEE